MPARIARLLPRSGSAFVLAEAAVNHNGSLETALQLVDAAHLAGADGIKFQMFRADRLVCAGAPTANYQRAAQQGESQRQMLRRLELAPDDFRRIAAHCRAAGIAFLATPFDPADVALLVELGVPAIKIASTDLTNRPLVDAAWSSGLPLLLSTGAATAEEIDRACRRYADNSVPPRLVLLHCVSCYPTPIEQANLAAIRTLAVRFARPVGYSDHTRSLITGAAAAALGAVIIEKHFTLDRAQPGPDHAMSLDPIELATYAAHTREAAAALGNGRLGYSPAEADVRRVARRSVVAALAIRAGQRLEPQMLALKRPGGGIEPEQLEQAVGRVAACDIPADTPLTWEMLRG